MRKLYIILIIAFVANFVVYSQGSLTIQGVDYRVDTLVHKHDVGLGAMQTYYSLPDMPLQVSVLEIDASNPYIGIESCLSHDTLRNIEPTSKMAARKSKPGNYVLAALNGDFYSTSGVDKGLTIGGQILKGQVARSPHATRPNVAFDVNNNMLLDVMTMSAKVTIAGTDHVIHGVNQPRGADQLILYNELGGCGTKTNMYGVEVLIEPLSGHWTVNEPVACEVLDVVDGVGNYTIGANKAVLSGHGVAAEALKQLVAGENITINLNMSLNSNPDLNYQFTNSIGGDRIILSDGLVQDNDWKEKHPRSAIGKSADGKRIILMVVEGRSTESIGVSTKQLAELMRHSGASDAFNLDGGGSSTLVVRGNVANVTSDGYERSVANALLFTSKAPDGKAVSMQLNAQYMTVPFGQTRQVKASTFNEYGDVVEYLNAANVTYRVEGGIGTVDATGLFRATGSAGKGMIIGEWGSQSDTVHVQLKGIQSMYFEHSQLTIDHLNAYKFKVFGVDNTNSHIELDNTLIGFRSLDPSIGTVDAEGVFNGQSDGLVTVEVYTLDKALSSTCQIDVQIAQGTVLLDDFTKPDEWTVSSSWLDWVKLERGNWLSDGEEVLKVAYEMTYQNRTASITLDKIIPVYSMPDSLMLVAAGNGVSSSILLNLDHQSGSCFIPRFSGGDLVAHKARIAVENIAQTDYPLNYKSITLKVERNSQYVLGQKYTGAFYLKGLFATYPDKGVPTLVTKSVVSGCEFKLSPNPVVDKLVVEAKSIQQFVEFELYNLNGQLQKRCTLDFTGRTRVTIQLDNIPSGFYVFRINTYNGVESGKLVIR